MNGKLGTASAVIFFVNHTDPTHWPGYIMLAPYSACPTPEGYSREVADSIPAIRALERRMNEDAQREWEAEYLREEATLGALRQRKREQMISRLYSSETSEYDKEFINAALKLQDDKKVEKYQAAFEHRNVVLRMLHYDGPKDRQPNEERVDLDRIG